MDKVAAYGFRISRIVTVGFKRIAIKTVQSILRAEPHKSPAVLYAAVNGVVGQAILYLIVLKIIRLRTGKFYR